MGHDRAINAAQNLHRLVTQIALPVATRFAMDRTGFGGPALDRESDFDANAMLVGETR